MLSSKIFYRLIKIALAAGCIWLLFIGMAIHKEHPMPEVCIIKHTSGYPCPSCGSTRAVLLLLQGEMTAAILMNPMGIISLILAIILAFGLLYDMLTHQEKTYQLYLKAENFIKRPSVSIPLAILVVANWVWNIIKNV